MILDLESGGVKTKDFSEVLSLWQYGDVGESRYLRIQASNNLIFKENSKL